MKKVNKSYIIHSYFATQSSYNLIKSWLKDFNEETYQFFIHLLYSCLNIRHGKDLIEWVPVPAKTIQKRWGTEAKVSHAELCERGLIAINTFETEFGIQQYSKKNGTCREFKIAAKYLDLFLNNEDIELGKTFILVNLMTGKKRVKNFARHELKDNTGHLIPTLPAESMKRIKRCVVNYDSGTQYIDGLITDELWGNPTQRQIKSNRIDKSAWNTMRANVLKKNNDGTAEYAPGYKMQSTGRITEVGVGSQNCTRVMKDVIFKDIPNLFNYDLKSSQVWGLIQQFEDANLDISWLVEYLNKDKKEYADAVGISVDCWKSCFYALLFGGGSSSEEEQASLRNTKDSDTFKYSHKITQYLHEEAIKLTNNEQDAFELFFELDNKYKEVIAPLVSQIKAWHRWMIFVHPKFSGVSSYPQGQQMLTNACGCKFNLSEWKDKNNNFSNISNLGRKLAAFWLQGCEAAFIHHLTVVSSKYGFEVISNQHDGLVTLGAIPNEAIEYAREESGLRYAKLEVKSFN